MMWPRSFPLWLRVVVATLLFPVLVAGVVPWRLAAGSWYWPLPLGPAGWLGVLPLAAGVVVLFLTIRDFAREGGGTLVPWDAPPDLVRGHLYGRVRNPMYLGVLCCIMGQALLWRSGGVLIYGALVAFAFHIRVALFEEPQLARQFGAPYQAYLASVPRWLPRFRVRDRDRETGS